MSKVPTKPLFALCRSDRSICYGIVQPGKPHPKGVPIVRVNNFRDNSLDLADVLLVDPQIEKKFSRSRPTPGDVLVTLVGTIGQVAIAPPEIAGWNVARAVAVVPVRDAHHAEWVYFALQTPEAQNFIHQHANTTVQATFNLRDLAALPIPYPSQYRREAALRLLSSLRQKIELNRQMNKTLEAMAQAIFRDWFVDFGPTRRKLAGATDPVEIMGGLVQDASRAAELAALFPELLGDNGLPEGWEAGSIVDVATLNPEAWSATNHPDRIEYVDLTNTKWGRIEATATFRWEEAPSRARRVVRVGDTIVGTVRPGNGSYAFVGRNGLTASTGFAVLRPRALEFAPVVYCAATRPENINRLALEADGGAYPAVRPEAVIRTEFPKPSGEVMIRFGEICLPLFQKIEANQSEIKTLAALRDLLLPKLMSGEIRVEEVGASTGGTS